MSEKENGKKRHKIEPSCGEKTQFTSDNQPSPEAKSKGWKIKKAYKEVAKEALEKVINKGALDDLIAGFADLKKVEQIAILEHLRDSSGQKPKDEPQTIIMPSINIKGI